MTYRAEIDGLRAVAVIAVIFFHAGFEFFRGGFVGVDVFFVISGYLITTLLINDLQNRQFSLLHFYERRARRLLPALFFVVALCTPFAWAWVLPTPMEAFARSVIAVSLFVSNVLFWWEGGYFALAADQSPLLHTWSLAVEEQFYIFFPVFILLVWRFFGRWQWSKNGVFWAVVLAAAISFALSEWAWRNAPTANFYWAPTRAWELLAGAMAAFVVQKRGVQANDVLASLGLAAIVVALFAYNENTPFPGAYALVPVAGVVLIILFAGKNTLTAKLLSEKHLVGIGLVSYSAYLWHQPLFAFARMRYLNTPSDSWMMLLSVSALGLGWLSWKFVEQPFRHPTTISSRQVVLFAVTGTLGFFILGSTYMLLPSERRYSDSVRILDFFPAQDLMLRDGACAIVDGLGQRELCVLGDPLNVRGALLGDSHAQMLWHPLNTTLGELGVGMNSYTGGGGCLPIRNAYRRDHVNTHCHEYNSAVLDDIIQSDDIEFVVLSGRWTSHIEASRFDNGEGDVESGAVAYVDVVENGRRLKSSETIRADKVLAQMGNTISQLLDSGKTVFVVSPVPEVGFNVPQRLAKAELYGIDDYAITHSYQRFLSRNKRVRGLFDALAATGNKSLHLVDVSEKLCSDSSGRCAVMNNDSQLLYMDDNHLSSEGAAVIVEQIAAVLGTELAVPRL